MALLSKSFKLSKTDSASRVTKFLQTEIGEKAYLFKDIEVSPIGDSLVNVTIIYEDYSDLIYESIAPRPGSIFTSDIALSNFDARILFLDKIDPNSIESGTFIVDNVGLGTGDINFPADYGSYYVKLDLSSYTSEDFHDFRIDTSKIKRFDGSEFNTSPVGGYILHNQSSAYIGDLPTPIRSRIRGLLNLAIVKIEKNYSPERAILDIINRFNISQSQLLTYKSAELVDNTYIYLVYVSPQEPQIVQGFPLNNSLLPDIAAPNYVTLTFSTELSAVDLALTSYFSIEEDYVTSTDISTSDIELLADKRTVRIDTSSYLTSQKVYSIVVKPGLPSAIGYTKTKPEQWTIHVNRYEGGASATGVAGVVSINGRTGVLTLEGLGDITVSSSPGTLSISGDNYRDDITGHTGQTGIHYTIDQITITESQISDLREYTELNLFTGHTGQTGIHYTMDQINITTSQISDISNYTLLDVFTGHSGQTGIHYEMDQIFITESQITDLGVYTDLELFTGHTGAFDPHTNYLLEDGSRGIINPISGATPTLSYHLATKQYVDDSITSSSSGASPSASYIVWENSEASLTNEKTITGQSGITVDRSSASVVINWNYLSQFTGHTGQTGTHYTQDQIDHSLLQNLTSDTHTQYILVDGTRAFTGPVSGATPTQDAHLATKQYVDDVVGPTPVEDLNDLNDVTTVAATGVFLYNFSGVWEELYVSGGSGIELVESGDLLTISNTIYDDFTGHTGNSSIHFTQAAISITESQISDLGNYLTNVDGLSGDFTGHTGDSSIHFTQAEISITESQISDLGSYLTSETNDLTSAVTWANVPDANITESSVTQHEAALTITESQISDLGSYATISAFTGHTGDTSIHFTEASIDHGSISGLGDDDHTQYSLVDGTRAFSGPVSGATPTQNAHLATKLYIDQAVSNAVITDPTSSSDNSILAGADIVPLSLTANISQTNNLFRAFNNVAQKNFYLGSDAKPYAADATSYSGLVNYNQFTGHTGASDPHTAYLLTDGSRAMASTLNMNSNLISNVANPVGLGDAINLGYLAGIVGLYMARANSLSDVQSVTDARNNLGLGTAAVEDVGDLAISGEQITSSGATNGQILTADGAGNSTWEDAPSGGGSSSIEVMHFLMTGSQDIGGVNTNQFVINWGEIFESGTAFLPSGDTGIQVLESGRYVISAAVGWQNQGANRIGYLGYVRKNGTEDIKRCTSRNYSRGAGYSDGSNTVYTELVLASGDFVEVVLEVDDTDSAGYVVPLISGQCEFFMRKL